MKNLSIFKIKVCICELVLISILAVTGVFVFAVGPAVDDNKIADIKTAESSSVAESSKKDTSDVVPVVVLDDGKKARVISLSDFLKLAQNPKVDAVVPADQIKNMIDLVRLKNEIKKSDANEELLKKLDKIAEKIDKKPTIDAWWKEGWKEAIKMPKDFLRSIGVSAVKYIVGCTICGIMIIGGAILTYKYIVLPTGVGQVCLGFFNMPNNGGLLLKLHYMKFVIISGLRKRIPNLLKYLVLCQKYLVAIVMLTFFQNNVLTIVLKNKNLE